MPCASSNRGDCGTCNDPSIDGDDDELYTCCSSQHPWTTRIQGPNLEPGEFGLVFHPLHPCGAIITPNVVASESDFFDMITIATWEGCLGDREVSDRVLITGHVTALESNRIPSTRRPILGNCADNVTTCVPWAKLKITACGQPGAVIIDSDSEVVIPAGNATIEIIAPGVVTGITGGAWTAGRGPTVAEAAWIDATVRVAACPLTCCYCPEGRLTEWMENENDPGVELIRLLRPRRARRLSVSTARAGSGPVTTDVRYFNSAINATEFSSRTFPASPSTEELLGSIDSIDAVISTVGQTGFTHVTWGIR